LEYDRDREAVQCARLAATSIGASLRAAESQGPEKSAAGNQHLPCARQKSLPRMFPCSDNLDLDHLVPDAAVSAFVVLLQQHCSSLRTGRFFLGGSNSAYAACAYGSLRVGIAQQPATSVDAPVCSGVPPQASFAQRLCARERFRSGGQEQFALSSFPHGWNCFPLCSAVRKRFPVLGCDGAAGRPLEK